MFEYIFKSYLSSFDILISSKAFADNYCKQLLLDTSNLMASNGILTRHAKPELMRRVI
ncbi:hypothetical protein BAC3_02102 [uncultured bacterium]|nr:hypothetical protein BAC3_02102 [uncultured bacterium]